MRTLSLALSMALIAAIQNTHAASYFTLTSTSIADGARIPVRFGADDKQRACRPGSAISSSGEPTASSSDRRGWAANARGRPPRFDSTRA